MAETFIDLVCPNDACPGGYGPQAGPHRRNRWTARGHSALGHNIIAEEDLVCSDCNTPGVDTDAVTMYLPTYRKDVPMETITRTVQFGAAKVTLEWPAALADDWPSIDLNLHTGGSEVVDALGGPGVFKPPTSDYLQIIATDEKGEQIGDFTFWPKTKRPSSYDPVANPVVRQVRDAQREEAGYHTEAEVQAGLAAGELAEMPEGEPDA